MDWLKELFIDEAKAVLGTKETNTGTEESLPDAETTSF